MKLLQHMYLAGCMLCLASLGLTAQNTTSPTPDDSEKRVIIVRTTVDEEGNKVTERSIYEGEKAEHVLIELESEGSDDHLFWMMGEDDSDVISVEKTLIKTDEQQENIIIEQGEEIEVIELRDQNDPDRVIKIQGAPMTEEQMREIELKHARVIEIQSEANDQQENAEMQMQNIEVNVEEVNGEKLIVLRKSSDGKEEVVKWRAKDGLPGEIEGELARIRIARHHAPEETMAQTTSWGVNTNCAALGVYVGTHENTVRVSSIIAESGAEQSGLRQGDVIHTINGEEVRNFKELRNTLSAYIPGDVVKIAYERNGESHTVETELKAWKDLPSMKDSHLANIMCDDIYAVTPEKDNIDETPGDGGVKTGLNQSPLKTLEVADFSMYPNPSDGRVQVSFTAEAVPTQIRILDVSGKEIYTNSLDNFSGEFNQEIDITDQARGSFILMIEQDGKVYSEQLVVQ